MSPTQENTIHKKEIAAGKKTERPPKPAQMVVATVIEAPVLQRKACRERGRCGLLAIAIPIASLCLLCTARLMLSRSIHGGELATLALVEIMELLASERQIGISTVMFRTPMPAMTVCTGEAPSVWRGNKVRECYLHTHF